MEWKDQYVLVFGAGLSGIAAVNLLSGKAGHIILYDTNPALNQEELQKKLPKDWNGELVLGSLKEEQKQRLTLIVVSPGVPTDSKELKELTHEKIPVWGEIELAYHFSKGILAAITGTNGKTTTTALTGEILKTYYEDVFVVGNIGIPYTKMAKQTTEHCVTVAEVSSFQLETIVSFHPNVSVILNLTPDHLNRHHTMENYIAAKANIMKNQTSDDICVLNYEDEQLRRLAEVSPARIVWFSSQRPLAQGLFLEQGQMKFRDGTKEDVLCNVCDMKLLGTHNYENAMAAAAVGMALSVSVENIRKALLSFVAVEHRIEYVDTIEGVKYYNDSKGTNPDASIQAIRAMPSPTLLIGGGYDKGSDYEPWIAAFEGKVKYLVLMGQTREKIAETARRMGISNIVLVDSMEEAVNFCRMHAVKGDCVLLSPCCASWGMFQNYEERGRIFKSLVRTFR